MIIMVFDSNGILNIWSGNRSGQEINFMSYDMDNQSMIPD